MIRFDSSLPSRLTQPNRVSSATRPTAVKHTRTHKRKKEERVENFQLQFPNRIDRNQSGVLAYIPAPICTVRPKSGQAIRCSRRASRALCKMHSSSKSKMNQSNNSINTIVYAIGRRIAHLRHQRCDSVPVCDVAVNYLSIKSLAISLSGTIYLRAVDGCSITCWTCARKLSHFSPWLRSMGMCVRVQCEIAGGVGGDDGRCECVRSQV